MTSKMKISAGDKPIRRKIFFTAKEVSRYSVALLANQVQTLLSPVYIAALSPESYGFLELAYSMIGFLSIVLSCGLHQLIGIRYYKEKDPVAASVKVTLVYLVVATPVCAILSLSPCRDWAMNFLFENRMDAAIFVLVIWTAYLMFFKNFLLSLLTMAYRTNLYVVFELSFATILFACVRFASRIDGLSVESILIFNIAALSPVVFYIAVRLVRKGFFENLRGYLGDLRFGATLRVSLPLVGLGLCVWAVNLIDRWLLLKLGADAGQIGIYSLAYRISGVLPLFVAFMVGNIYNRYVYKIFAARKADTAALAVFARSNSKIALGFGGILALLLVFYYLAIVWLFPRVYPPEYARAFPLMPYLLVGYFANVLTTFYSTPILFLEKTMLILLVNAAGVVVNVLANVILVPDNGMWGAAVSTMITFIFILFVMIAVNLLVFRLRC